MTFCAFKYCNFACGITKDTPRPQLTPPPNTKHYLFADDVFIRGQIHHWNIELVSAHDKCDQVESRSNFDIGSAVPAAESADQCRLSSRSGRVLAHRNNIILQHTVIEHKTLGPVNSEITC